MEEMNRPNEPGTTSTEDVMSQGQRVYDETRRAVGTAYDRSAHAIHETYDHALEYGRNNPGKALLIAFGIGVGFGVLLVGSGRRSRVSRYGEPIVNALSNMAREFIRGM